MKRKALTEVRSYISNDLDNDKNALIMTLLKRACTYEEAMDYLLSAIDETIRDGILGELLVWDANIRKLRKAREDR